MSKSKPQTVQLVFLCIRRVRRHTVSTVDGMNGVWDDVLATGAVNNLGRVGEVLVVSWLCLSDDDFAE